MRYISAELKSRLSKAVLAKSTNANPASVIWLSRSLTPLLEDALLERQTVLTAESVSAVSMAARRINPNNAADHIFAAYITSGVGKVVMAAITPVMSAHAWQETTFSEPASDIALAFDGTMPRQTSGKIEFVTEAAPWVLWVASGALYARRLGQPETQAILADRNVTAVSAVRGMWSEAGGIDIGLVAFFIANGEIYSRQLIRGAWTDGAPIGFGPAGKTWVDIAASRTWDYRLALQAKASDGGLWELFTQFEGVAKQNTEHVEMADVKADGKRIKVTYLDAKAGEEKIELAAVSASGAITYALSPKILSAENLSDAAGDWGKTLRITLDYPVTGLAWSVGAFTITDANKIIYYATEIKSGEGTTVIVLGFADFNAAAGVCTAAYAPGTVMGPVAALAAGSMAFTPTGLVPPKVSPPIVAEVWNE